jgi:hypothetical protein
MNFNEVDVDVHKEGRIHVKIVSNSLTKIFIVLNIAFERYYNCFIFRRSGFEYWLNYRLS